MYKTHLKRLFDFCLSLAGLLLLSPVFVLLWMWTGIASRGTGTFFIQPRSGKNEKVFKLIKFKTMNDSRDSKGELLPDAARLTAVGKFLRSASLDELPQLINVLKGDMSLVGPRPLLVEYLPLYGERQKIRHSIRPGITGWAQVNGRNAISWEQKFEYDVYYAENLSFGLDFKILILSLKMVLKREGITQDGKATIDKFKGNNL